MELRAACSQDVNRLLFEYVGATTLDVATEVQLSAHIKSVAVKGTCKEVHRMNFFKLAQMDGETITQYIARLRAQYILCQFKVGYTDSNGQPKQLSYIDDMMTQQLISGLKNHHHQNQVLSEAAVLTTLQSKIQKLQCLEATVSSTEQMRIMPPSLRNENTIVAPIRSSYKRDNRNQQSPQKPSTNRCRGCGRSSHEGKTMSRKDCPSFNKSCGSCGIKGHFRAVCQIKTTEHQASSWSNAVNNFDDT